MKLLNNEYFWRCFVIKTSNTKHKLIKVYNGSQQSAGLFAIVKTYASDKFFDSKLFATTEKLEQLNNLTILR